MSETLSRTDASAAVDGSPWRYLLATLATSADVSSAQQAVQVAQAAVAACGAEADGHLRLDLRPGRVELTLQSTATRQITQTDVVLAGKIGDAVAELGLELTGATGSLRRRSVQSLEIAIDTMDVAAIRPFWRAVLGYADEGGGEDPDDAVIDPVGQGPTVWFQQMDEPRPQRNRIHFDVTVSHDEAPRRIQAALDAGGVLVSDAAARAFWILADSEGNEICVCTWQDRDSRPAG